MQEVTSPNDYQIVVSTGIRRLLEANHDKYGDSTQRHQATKLTGVNYDFNIAAYNQSQGYQADTSCWAFKMGENKLASIKTTSANRLFNQ